MPHATIVPFTVAPTEIDGLWILQMKQVSDERGTVREFYRESAFAHAGLLSLGPWVQVNVTETRQGAIRGIHAEETTKLVAVAAGEAFGAYVDTRLDSVTFGRVVTVALTPGVQVLVPAGVGNGFQSISPGVTQYLYGFAAEWVAGMAGTAVTPLDPALRIPWPIAIDASDPAQLTAKDASASLLAELPASRESQPSR